MSIIMTLEEIEKEWLKLESSNPNSPANKFVAFYFDKLLSIAKSVKKIGPAAWRTLGIPEDLAPMFGEEPLDDED